MHHNPKSTHILIPEPCDCVTIHHRRDLEDVIQMKDFEMESLSEKDLRIEEGQKMQCD